MSALIIHELERKVHKLETDTGCLGSLLIVMVTAFLVLGFSDSAWESFRVEILKPLIEEILR